MTADRSSGPGKKTSTSGKGGASKGVVLRVSTGARPEFDHPLIVHAFDGNGTLLDSAEVASGKVTLALSEKDLARTRVFVAPAAEGVDDEETTPEMLVRLGAYEPVLTTEDGGITDRIVVPGSLIDLWPLCFCWVRGRVVRASDGAPVCNARVHVCEVDRIPWWILRLPDLDVLRLRDDLINVLRRPIPPIPIPDPPDPIERPLFRLPDPASTVEFDPQPDPAGLIGPMFGGPGPELGVGTDLVSATPVPEPPNIVGPMFNTAGASSLSAEVLAGLASPSTTIVRTVLAENWHLIAPWFCIWPWWWWRFRCDEVAVRTTDPQGRFEATILYPCGGDHPDLYFWVEYDFGSGFETVHHPPIPCNTHWDYPCGTEVTIRVADSRVPSCDPEPDLDGCQVVIKSIGRTIAVRELKTDAAGPADEGLTTSGRPLGGTLEFRVDFSRTCLIDDKNIPYYQWSWRRVSGPDGTTPDSTSWAPLTRAVYRHYSMGTSFPSEPMGPLPTSGADAAPAPNLFHIRPALSPVGGPWVNWDEHVDLSTGYFETASLPGAPMGGPTATGPAPDDLAAGRYELKLELFDVAGNLVNWTASGIDLRIPEQNAPFGTAGITTEPAPAYNRILDPGSGDTLGFRMVVRVDNNRCYAEVNPVAGDVPPDPACGFHEYSSLTDDARLSFVARHPNRFATYSFVTRRATGPSIPDASTSGVAGLAGTNGFLHTGGFGYQKDVTVGTLLGPCERAAFSERLGVEPMVTNGYSVIWSYRHSDVAAFALAKPCDPCECEDGGPGRGRGQGGGRE